jgi:manganese-dependent inorganic pyrophosphatase
LGKINLDEFATGFFSAGSALQQLPAEEALESDRKTYEEIGFRISISQIEELGLSHFDAKRDELAATLEELRYRDGLEFACAMVTDITKNNSMLLTAGDARVIERIEYPSVGEGVFRLDGVVSRKKQLFPALSRVLGGVERADGAPVLSQSKA